MLPADGLAFLIDSIVAERMKEEQKHEGARVSYTFSRAYCRLTTNHQSKLICVNFSLPSYVVTKSAPVVLRSLASVVTGESGFAK